MHDVNPILCPQQVARLLLSACNVLGKLPRVCDLIPVKLFKVCTSVISAYISNLISKYLGVVEVYLDRSKLKYLGVVEVYLDTSNSAKMT